MGFALLGCSPLWSCCGFDYHGQPIHKFHQYGRIYFILRDSIRTKRLWEDALHLHLIGGKTWEFLFLQQSHVWDLHIDFKNVIPQWSDEHCPHYSEQAVQYINQMEQFLVMFRDDMLDVATVVDSNSIYKKVFRHWQYPSKGPWTFTKQDFLEEIYGTEN